MHEVWQEQWENEHTRIIVRAQGGWMRDFNHMLKRWRPARLGERDTARTVGVQAVEGGVSSRRFHGTREYRAKG